MLALVSGRDITIIAAAAAGGAVCVGVVLGALLYMKKRTKPIPSSSSSERRGRSRPPWMWKDKRQTAAGLYFNPKTSKGLFSPTRTTRRSFLSLL